MQWMTKASFGALGLLVCFSACAESPAPVGDDSAVDSAYAALVSEVANCAKQLKSCEETAGSDDAALAVCRDQFGSCRQDAGKANVNALASAVRACTSEHNKCVRAAEHTEAGGCQDALRTCLGAAHAEERDDEDAGNEQRKAARADCLDELHPCVKADGPANACAEQVRMCLVDSVPSPIALAPDAADATSDPGRGRDKDMRAKPADATDAGPRGTVKMNEARLCVDTLRTCIDAGNPARECAKSLKECRATATP